MSMSNYRSQLAAAACVAAALLGCGPAQGQEAVALGKRYTDAIHGFSLRPPTDTQRTRDFSPGRLASWAYHDEQTGAVVWTLSVHSAVEANTPIDLRLYSEALAEKLRLEKDLNVETVQVGTAAGKPAIHLRGQTVGIRMWQRQSWILTAEGVFLIVIIQGPLDRRSSMDAVCEAVLASLELTDPTRALELRKANLERGEKLLASLTGGDLGKALRGGAQWYLLRVKNQDVGFQRIIETQARREDVDGYLVRMWAMLQLPGYEARVIRQEMFVSPDLAVERWLKRLQVGSDEQTASAMEHSMLRQHDLIVCNVLDGDRLQSFKKSIPGRFYLPQAAGMLLPRLVDLTRPAAYAFAAYNVEENDFDLRTFTVIGAERITVMGREVDAVAATDRPRDDAEPARLYLDKDGNILEMRTVDGLVMEQSSEQAVMRRFPNAAQIIKALGE